MKAEKKSYFRGLSTAIKLLLFLFLSTNLCYACNSPKPAGHTPSQSKGIADTLIKGDFEAASNLVFDSTKIDKFLRERPAFKAFTNDFRKFYRLRKYSYAWYDRKGLTEQARNVITHVDEQQNEGVLKSIPDKNAFYDLIDSEAGQTAPDINMELMLTGQYFNYARNVWMGSASEKTASIGWYLPRKKLSYSELLQKNLTDTAKRVTESAIIPQYTKLKASLALYEKLEKEHGEQPLPYTSALPLLKPGDTAAALGQISQRLYLLGDLKNGAATKHIYDAQLQRAVMQFKTRHGLTANTTIDRSFIKQLNVPAKKRIEQILVNLERMRWIPVNRKSDEFVLVNIPEYRLHYYQQNKSAWDCRVVVGKAMTKTVIFSGNMQYVVFRPYWYVPQSIINKEIRPGMKKNRNYLADHNMEWNGGHVRQKPGVKNSLGLVKFIFPNSHDIYLHDTPSKSFFKEDARAFSHGCVRVAKPRELALSVLKPNGTWTPEKIDSAMETGPEKSVTLKKSIPVYIGYFTAFVDKNGLLNFRDDIYQRDDRLLALLMQE